MSNDRKVLVIDDEAHIRRVVQIKLENNGYKVMVAKNGEEGLDMIHSQQPDVVISDINMPKLDGRSLCEQTNVLKEERPFLTIVITARILPEDETWIQDMQKTYFMEKPFSPSKLLERVDHYFAAEG